MSVRMRHTRAHTKNRRSHHALKEPRLSACSKCNAQHIRHRACLSCGTYRGRVIVNISKKILKKEEKAKEREKVKEK